ncbi:MAG: YdaS family helix-turn-helix protein [Pseudomonadota bacterium]|nr:YdaS family helix-turn-helix protein [Pseudomonadota bacterium]
MITRSQVLTRFRTPAEAARKLGITRQAIQEWKGSDAPIPAERVLPIYQATRGAVTLHELRPDLYPDPDWLPPLEPEDTAGAGSSREVA